MSSSPKHQFQRDESERRAALQWVFPRAKIVYLYAGEMTCNLAKSQLVMLLIGAVSLSAQAPAEDWTLEIEPETLTLAVGQKQTLQRRCSGR